jgi:hypothetical protein
MVNALQTFSKQLDTQLIDPLRNVLKGRKLVTVTQEKGFGVSSVDWGKITDIGDGMISYGFRGGNEDTIDVTLTNSKVPIYWKDYKIDRRIYEGWRNRGIDIDAASAIAAAYKAAKAEDTAIIMGVANDSSTYDYTGLYQGAGNDYSTNKDVATYGNLSTAIAGAYQLMDDDSIPVDSLAFNLGLSSAQYMEAISVRNSVSHLRELPDIIDMLNGGGIFSLGTILTAGTGILLPTPASGSPYVDFYLTSDFKTEHGIDSSHPDTGDLNGRVYSAGVLRIKQSNAICKLSSI